MNYTFTDGGGWAIRNKANISLGWPIPLCEIPNLDIILSITPLIDLICERNLFQENISQWKRRTTVG